MCRKHVFTFVSCQDLLQLTAAFAMSCRMGMPPSLLQLPVLLLTKSHRRASMMIHTSFCTGGSRLQARLSAERLLLGSSILVSRNPVAKTPNAIRCKIENNGDRRHSGQEPRSFGSLHLARCVLLRYLKSPPNSSRIGSKTASMCMVVAKEIARQLLCRPVPLPGWAVETDLNR